MNAGDPALCSIRARAQPCPWITPRAFAQACSHQAHTCWPHAAHDSGSPQTPDVTRAPGSQTFTPSVVMAQDKWPGCLIQFEDFATDKAFAILERMQDKFLCFNDDIQGTGAVVTSGYAVTLHAFGSLCIGCCGLLGWDSAEASRAALPGLSAGLTQI